MTRYVAFLRGIGLGRRRPKMSVLAAAFAELGFRDVATFLNSGNVIFSSGTTDTARLETRIARHLQEELGYEVPTFIRSGEEVRAIGGAQVFAEDGRDDLTVHVALCAEPLSGADARALERIRTPMDEFRVAGRDFYWMCRGSVLESKVWSLPEVKALRLPPLTMRNMTSVRRLIAKHLVG